MNTAVIYLRVSTLGQAVDGYGLDAQLDACRKYAKGQGLTVAEVHRDEGVSGTKAAHERPGLTAALASLTEGDVLVMARLDRLARDLATQEAIFAAAWSSGASVHSADVGEWKRDDPDDPFRTSMRQMAGVFAELERRLVVKRLRDGRSAKAQKGGKAVGRYPYGWDRTGAIEDEQRLLRRARALRGKGRTWQEVADRFNSEGLLNRSGTHWTAANTAKVMSR